MYEKETLVSMIDELSPDNLEEIYQHIKQRRQVIAVHKVTGTVPIVAETVHTEPAETIRAEVNALIDDLISEICHKHDTPMASQ